MLKSLAVWDWLLLLPLKLANDKFGNSYEDTFVNAINWILDADRSKFVCANEQYYLLFEDSPITWRAEKCEKFLDAAVDLWKQW